MASGPLKGNEGNLAAGYIPFAKTKAERLAKSDPRPSLEERYGNIWNYYYLANISVNELVTQRFLLPADAQRLLSDLVSDLLKTEDLSKTPNNLRPDLKMPNSSKH